MSAQSVRIEYVPLEQVRRWPRNPKRHNLSELNQSLERFGFVAPLVQDDSSGKLVAGHGRLEALLARRDAGMAPPQRIHEVDGDWAVPVLRGVEFTSEEEAEAYLVADNRLVELGGWDEAELGEMMRRVTESAASVEHGLRGTGITKEELDRLLASTLTPPNLGGNDERPNINMGSLAARFGVPPFSVLDARQGYWRERKNWWLTLGIQSEIGRGENLAYDLPDHLNRGAKTAAPGGGMFPSDRIGPDGKFARGDLHARVREPSGAKVGLFADGAVTTPSSRVAPGGSLEPPARQKVARAWAKSKNSLAERMERAKPGEDIAVSRGPSPARAEPGGVHIPGRTTSIRAPINAYSGGADTTVNRTGTSIFDPVLCELVYRWFCPTGGRVLDPFAGGSVRGVVAATLGLHYTGIDLRQEQVAANEEQWRDISSRLASQEQPEPTIADPVAMTPVQRVGELWLKRDDLFSVAGVRGGKVRTCWGLAQGASGLVTAGSRASPQVNIVAHVARALNIPCRVHTPSGEPAPEVLAAIGAGAEHVQHSPGYNNVIIARAREDAAAAGWREIPFGMECQAAVDATRAQARNLPTDAKRLVVPVGSGMSLAGILHGLVDAGLRLPVLGVVVGADPEERLDRWAPANWRDMVTLVRSDLDYHDAAPSNRIGDVVLDPHYEAKALPFLEPGDCFWVVGLRQTVAVTWHPAPTAPVNDPTWLVGDSKDVLSEDGEQVDLVFTCPPYFDLEVYSDDPRDLSNMTNAEFNRVYRDIVARAVARLRPNRFAVVVVGEVRGDGGFYRGLIPLTIEAFEDAGARFYNEAILVTAVGSLPVRVGRQFPRYRKLGKTHQNVLVFFKGDPQQIPLQFPSNIDVSLPELEEVDE
jgi:DNA modification methylase